MNPMQSPNVGVGGRDFGNKDRDMVNCPKCDSKDVGGSNGMAYCYRCDHEITASTTADAVKKWNAQYSINSKIS